MPVKKSTTVKRVVKKTPARKVVVKKTAVKKAVIKHAIAKKAVKKAAIKKTINKSPAVSKTIVKKTTARPSAKTITKQVKSPPKSLALKGQKRLQTHASWKRSMVKKTKK